MKHIKGMYMRLKLFRLLRSEGILLKGETLGHKYFEQGFGRALDDYLIKTGRCTEKELGLILQKHFNLPYINLSEVRADDRILELFDRQALKQLSVLPLRVLSDGSLQAVMSDPCDEAVMSYLRSEYSYKITPAVSTAGEIDRCIDEQYSSLSIDNDNIDNKADLDGEEDNADMKNVVFDNRQDAGQICEENIKNIPLVNLIEMIIKEAILKRADDIHIEPFKNCSKIRLRIDGTLRHMLTLTIKSHAEIISRIKILAGMDIAEKRIPQDGHMNIAVKNCEYDVRISTFPTIYGEKAVARILNKNTLKMHRREIGFNERNNVIVDDILSKRCGMVLLTGPTGCGKSTTLYSFLSEINKDDINTVTIEDPVEYMIDGINQSQVNLKINFTFAAALRAVLRQDPDVIMIGEIRDEETAKIATRAAITGHLVFSTLHTNDAPGAITRLINMGVNRYLVADALVAVISQRLVKRLCPDCKEKTIPSYREAAILGFDTAADDPPLIYRPKGCKKCDGTGYYGRIAVHEIMYVSEKIKNVIASGDVGSGKIREIALSDGMASLSEVCREYVLSGITDISEMKKLL